MWFLVLVVLSVTPPQTFAVGSAESYKACQAMQRAVLNGVVLTPTIRLECQR